MVVTTNIFFLGGPGVGKSTLTHGLVYELSKTGLCTQFIEESAKSLVYKGHKEQLDNQVLVSGLYWDSIMSVQGKCDLMVSDSHILVGMVYSSNTYAPVINLVPLYASIANTSMCVVVEPPHDLKESYEQRGREQDFQESLRMGEKIKDYVLSYVPPSRRVYTHRDEDLEVLKDKVLSVIHEISGGLISA